MRSKLAAAISLSIARPGADTRANRERRVNNRRRPRK